MKKILGFLTIAFLLGAVTISQSLAQVGGNMTRDLEVKNTYPNAEEFLEAEGDVCRVATDGCDSVQITNGQLGERGMMWCEGIYGEGGQEEWSCTHYIDNLTSEQKYIQDYITQNITSFVSQEAVLGGSWYIASFEWIDGVKVRVTAEEGHIQDIFIFDSVAMEVVSYENHQDDMIVCTMEYAPVCGIDGVTYGNACGAGDTEIAYIGECEELVSVSRLTRLNNIYESRFTNLVSQIDFEKRIKALEVIEQRIEMVRMSRIATWVQEQRITDLIFFRNIFQNAPYSE